MRRKTRCLQKRNLSKRGNDLKIEVTSQRILLGTNTIQFQAKEKTQKHKTQTVFSQKSPKKFLEKEHSIQELHRNYHKKPKPKQQRAWNFSRYETEKVAREVSRNIRLTVIFYLNWVWLLAEEAGLDSV